MTVSLTLFVSASLFVRLVSVPLAVAMCVIAAVIPPIAAFSANRGEPDEYLWDDSGDSAAGKHRDAAPGGADSPFQEGSPDAAPHPARPHDALDPSNRPPLNDPTLDELAWEEELRGYNGESFGRDS